MMPTYDCQKMPEKIKQAFYSLTDNYGNDCYVSHWVGDALKEEADDPGSYEEDILKKYRLVEDWLIKNGAIVGEEVIINHWW